MAGDAETLLRLLLTHGGGLSIEQTVLRTKEQGIRNISTVTRSNAFAAKRFCRNFL
jgi:hypothetical protein